LILIKNSHIRIFGYSLLLISVVVFLVTWMQWYIGIPASLLLSFGFYKISRNIKEDNRVLSISKQTIVLIFALVLAWVLLSGVGGAFPQKADMHWRNAILHDLINYSWPVRYSDGFDSSLTYYIAFWMVPAIFGKIAVLFAGAQAGWIVANIVSALYCAVIIFAVMLLIMSHLNVSSRNRTLLVLLILVMFSGMDVIPTIISQILSKDFELATHLEWWTYVQYSSNTTQIFWVVNQAIPSWLVVSLLLHENKMNHFAFLGLLLLPFGPLPFLGVFFLMVTQAFIKVVSAKDNKLGVQYTREAVSIPNLVAILTILPIFYLYYHSNATVSTSTALEAGSNWNDLYPGSYIIFLLIEFMLLVILLWKSYFNMPFFALSTFGLIVAPLFKFGSAQDFSMRVTIPFLFIIMVYTMDYLIHNLHEIKRKRIHMGRGVATVLAILIIGGATPITEYVESYLQILESNSKCTSIYADKIRTLDNGGMERDNFITKYSSDTFFYEYLAKKLPDDNI